MKKHIPINILAIIITAVIAVSGTYYYLSTQKQDSLVSQTNSSVKLKNVSDQNSNIIFDKSSKDYAIMGRQIWSSFQCSTLASIIGKESEAERLFIYGYNQGTTFIRALTADKIKEEDISSEVPVGVTWFLEGPTEDFILGRIYSSAEDNALEEVVNSDGEYNSDDMQKIIAGNKYRDGNCQLIGN